MCYLDAKEVRVSFPSTVDGIHSITKTSNLNKNFFSVGTKIYFVSVSAANYGELFPKVIVIIMLIIIIIMTNLPKKEEDSAKE